MLNVNAHKNFTSSGDCEAEKLIAGLLDDMRRELADTALCIILGGSYGRGEGGVRQDRENGLLYNDLDFFVFTEKTVPGAEKKLREFAEKYEKTVHIDVDFSRVMSVRDIRNNAKRLMMQELKRGYRLVCGKDLLQEYLPGIPADQLPFSEACRLLLNRGMGMLFAWEKISEKSSDKDFIIRNINKAALAAGDAILIAQKHYCWSISERIEALNKTDLPEEWKMLYRNAVEFKKSPTADVYTDMAEMWEQVHAFLLAATLRAAGAEPGEDPELCIRRKCKKGGELSVLNYVKYCVRGRTLPLNSPGRFAAPAVTVLVTELYRKLSSGQRNIDRSSKLYRLWQIFN